MCAVKIFCFFICNTTNVPNRRVLLHSLKMEQTFHSCENKQLYRSTYNSYLNLLILNALCFIQAKVGFATLCDHKSSEEIIQLQLTPEVLILLREEYVHRDMSSEENGNEVALETVSIAEYRHSEIMTGFDTSWHKDI